MLFDWHTVGTDEFHLVNPSPDPDPNPNPNPNPNQVGTDEFLGEALLGLEEYLDGARHSLKLELDQLKGNHDSHGSPVTGFVELEVSARG